jgi:hypothetical protein
MGECDPWGLASVRVVSLRKLTAEAIVRGELPSHPPKTPSALVNMTALGLNMHEISSRCRCKMCVAVCRQHLPEVFLHLLCLCYMCRDLFNRTESHFFSTRGRERFKTLFRDRLESKISRGSSGSQFASTGTAPTGTPEASEDDLCLELGVCNFLGRLDDYIHPNRPHLHLKRYYPTIAKHPHFTQISLRIYSGFRHHHSANLFSAVLPLVNRPKLGCYLGLVNFWCHVSPVFALFCAALVNLPLETPITAEAVI